ncbi:hypothetical protein QQF64_020842 [Cirrhinus molitorella]|uniref:Rho-GAP domain-containing protein n=1 Tax=Cirrhinus molitorella TaxID=172907 RepID=A0ABR3LDT5_9TELE
MISKMMKPVLNRISLNSFVGQASGGSTKSCVIVEFVEKHGLSKSGLFRIPGSVKCCQELRKIFDKGGFPEFDSVDILTLGSLLKAFSCFWTHHLSIKAAQNWMTWAIEKRIKRFLEKLLLIHLQQ